MGKPDDDGKQKLTQSGEEGGPKVETGTETEKTQMPQQPGQDVHELCQVDGKLQRDR